MIFHEIGEKLHYSQKSAPNFATNIVNCTSITMVRNRAKEVSANFRYYKYRSLVLIEAAKQSIHRVTDVLIKYTRW